MKGKLLFVIAGLMLAALLLSACAMDTTTGSAKTVLSGSTVTISQNGDGRIQVQLEGDSTTYFVDKFLLSTLRSSAWVRLDGSEWALDKVLGQQKDGKLTGYWVLIPVSGEKGKFDLRVYKDKTMADNAVKDITASSSSQ